MGQYPMLAGPGCTIKDVDIPGFNVLTLFPVLAVLQNNAEQFDISQACLQQSVSQLPVCLSDLGKSEGCCSSACASTIAAIDADCIASLVAGSCGMMDEGLALGSLIGPLFSVMKRCVTGQELSCATLNAPTESPIMPPTEVPTMAPTEVPTMAPTEMPTMAPTEVPTMAPTDMADECSATGVSTDGSALYNYACSGNLTVGDMLTCDGESACYAADDITCSGTPIDCPTAPAPGPTMSYKYKAYLKGKNELPPHVTKMWGWGWVEWTSDSQGNIMANITVGVKNAVDVTAAHIHNCNATCNGPVYVPIISYPESMSGTDTVTITVYLDQYPMLGELLESGNAYMNVHTKAYPGGEIRAQLMNTAPPQSIVSVASAIPELSYFVAAMAAWPAFEEHASDPSIEATIFAPSNAAFEAALIALGMPVGDLLSNTELLISVLSYHVHSPVLMAAMAPGPPGVNITSHLEGAMLHVVAIDGMVMINDAKVIVADISVNNYTSVIHIIDQVLIPPIM
ncbi:hypothetical protein FOA52_015719 [Chlamydomonas sp. UWO 241]|nr:hypothetical protein FOA52_015719 [Chlamydomonas sp. UWO 241]